MKTRLRRPRRVDATELNITAFMNLMVVLVPFLLVMAVFSRMTIHELSLPENNTSTSEEPTLQLEVTVRQDRLIVSDHTRGLRRELPNQDDDYDLDALSSLLQQLKSQAPDTVAATLLLEPDLSYEQLVRVMDTVRVMPVQQDERTIQAELFPDVSIGDAPQLRRGS